MLVRKRIYTGLNIGTKKERYAKVKEIIADATAYLEHQTFLTKLSKREYFDTLEYFNHQRVKTAPINCIKRRMAEYLSEIAHCVLKKTLQDYTSKLRHFGIWLEKEKLLKLDVKQVERQHINNFAITMSESGLSRKTIKTYTQAIHAYFEWEIEKGTIKENPVTKIKNYGKLVDCAAIR